MQPIDDIPQNLRWLFRLAIQEFALDVHGIHGPTHWVSVFRNAVEIAEADEAVDPTVVRLFAILHDCKREHDGGDRHHGRRAAELFLKLQRDYVLDLSGEQIEKLVFALRYHNHAVCGLDRTIGACFDADRLDLVRIPVIPDPAWLSTEAARRILESRRPDFPVPRRSRRH